MSGIKSQRKGKVGEREARKIMQVIVDKACEMNGVSSGTFVVQRNLLQSTTGGRDLLGCPGMAVEIKRAKVLRLKKWWTQTVDQALRVTGRVPVLLYRQDYHEWKARVYAKTPVTREAALEGGVDLDLHTFTTWALAYIGKRLTKSQDLTCGYINNEGQEDCHD